MVADLAVLASINAARKKQGRGVLQHQLEGRLYNAPKAVIGGGRTGSGNTRRRFLTAAARLAVHALQGTPGTRSVIVSHVTRTSLVLLVSGCPPLPTVVRGKYSAVAGCGDSSRVLDSERCSRPMTGVRAYFYSCRTLLPMVAI